MRWTPGGVSGDIEDRRADGGGPFRGSHLGAGATLLLLLLSIVFRRDFLALFSGSPDEVPGDESGLAQCGAGPGGSQARTICILCAGRCPKYLGAAAAATGRCALPPRETRPFPRRHRFIVRPRSICHRTLLLSGGRESLRGPRLLRRIEKPVRGARRIRPGLRAGP